MEPYFFSCIRRRMSLLIALILLTAAIQAAYGQNATLAPTSLAFGSIALGSTSAAKVVTLSNGSTVALSVSSIVASGDFAQSNTCGSSVAAKGSCKITVTFQPTATGARTGNITITDNASSTTQTINLTGTGIAQVTVSPLALGFGSVAVGTTSAAKTVTVKNNQTTAMTISVGLSGDYAQSNNCGSSLGAGASCTINVTFTPTATGGRPSTLVITDNASASPQTSVNLTGTGIAPVTITPASLSFGSVAQGATSAAKTITVKNNQTTPLTISSITPSGDYAQTNTCGASLAAVSSCTVSVTFTPTATGSRPGTVAITTSAGSQSVSLSGTGTAPVTISPASLAFGSVTQGTTSAAKTFTIKNNSTTPLALSGVTPSGPYAQTNNCGASLAAAASCTVSVTFRPTALGSQPGTVTITDSAVTSPQSVALTGVGGAQTITSIAITPAAPTVPKGKTQQLTAIATYNNATTQDVTATATWVSASPTIATVTKGLVTAVATGTSTITVSVTGSTVKGTTVLTVSPPSLVSIAVTPASSSVVAGKTQPFTATGTYSDNTTQNITSSVTWSSATPTVATVNTAGLATGVAAGSANIVATSGTVTGSTTLSVTPATLVSVAVTPANPSFAKGTTLQFTATGSYTDGSTQNLTTQVAWSSSTPNVTISNTPGTQGLATASSVGANVSISAALGTVSSSTTATVTPAALVSIAVTTPSASVALGLKPQFTATGTFTDATTQDITSTVTWSSSNTSAATISNTLGSFGQATTLAAGTITITATSGAVSNSTALTVLPAALVSIAVTPANPSIAAGTNQQFTATGTYTDNTTQDLTTAAAWNFTTAGVATISNTAGSIGLATGTVQGATGITATVGSITGNTQLTVTAAVLTAITVNPTLGYAYVGATQQFTATGTYSDSTKQDITAIVSWSAGDGSIGTISNSTPTFGLATGVAPGFVTITATSGSLTGSTQLLVVGLSSITVTPGNSSFAAGTQLQLTATGNYTDQTTKDLTTQVTWSSSDPNLNISNTAGSQGRATSLVPLNYATVTATLGAVSGNTLVTVSAAAVVSIAVTPASPTVSAGFTQQFTATGTFTDASQQDITSAVTWNSSDPTIATISNAPGSAGLASTLKPGAVNITATSGSVTSNPGATLTVSSATLVSIAVTPASVSLGVGNQQQFTATGTYSDNSTQDLTSSVTWSSANTSVVSISSTGMATVLGSSSTAIAITASSGSVTSGPAWFSALAALPLTCPTSTIDMKLLVVTNGQTEADFPAIKQILDYLGTSYTVVDVSTGVAASDLSDGNCHGYYQGVIFAFGGYIYSMPGMNYLTNYEQTFGVRQLNWYMYPLNDFGFNQPYNGVVDSSSTWSANFTPAAATVFPYLNTATPLSISNAAVYLGTALPGTSATPLLVDSFGNTLSLIYDFGDGRQYLTQTFDSNPYLTHDLVLAYGLINWVTKGVFLGEYHVYAAAQVDDFFINDSEWIPGTPCTDPITHDRTPPDAASLPVFRLNLADMTALTAWQDSVQKDPLLSGFGLSLAFNGIGTTGDPQYTGVQGADDLTLQVQSYQAKFHWMSHTYDHPETLNGLHQSDPNGDIFNTPPLDSIDYEIPTNNQAGITLGLTDFNSASLVTPGVTGLNDPFVPVYLYNDGVRWVVTDTSVIGQANNGPNPSPNVGMVNSFAPGIYEVPRHPNDVFFNAANWNDDQAEFSCIYNNPVQPPFNTFNAAQILDFVSSSFVTNMLMGDMDPQMFHQPNLHNYDGQGHSLISDVYDQTFAKYEALYKLPVLSLTLDQLGLAMQNRNSYNLSGATASLIGVGSATPNISITVPATAPVPNAIIPVSGLNSSGAENYGGKYISHISMTAGQTVTLPVQ